MKQGLVSIAILVLMVASLGSVVHAEFAPEPKVYNVKTFGAIGDGVTMDTKALQAAIEACNENHGGGAVWIPAWNYPIGRFA